MELANIERKENALLDRQEVYFTISHEKEQTPKRTDVKGLISQELNVEKERIVVDSMNSRFGMGETSGYAKVYPSKLKAQELEQKALLKRNNIAPSKKEKQEGEG